MPRSRPPYDEEYKRQIVELHRAGRSVMSLCREFEPTEMTIRKWIKQAALDAGERDDGLTTAERDELRKLRRDVRRLREERDILKKAAAWFARETRSIPEKGSGS